MMNKILMGAAAVATVLIPGAAFAQTYAYVDTAGEVRTMDASAPDQAIMTAPNIAVHSGVMLIESDSDPVVGDSVSGT